MVCLDKHSEVDQFWLMTLSYQIPVPVYTIVIKNNDNNDSNNYISNHNDNDIYIYIGGHTQYIYINTYTYLLSSLF